MNHPRYYASLIILIYLAACKPLYPDLPAEQYHTPTVAQSLSASALCIPLKMAISDLEKQFNQQMPAQLYDAKRLPNIDQEIGLRVFKSGALQLSGKEDKLIADIPLKLELRGNYRSKVMGLNISAPIDQTVAIRIRMSLEVRLQSNWQLKPKSKLIAYEWIQKPMLKVGFLKVNLAPFVDDFIREHSAEFTQTLDQEIAPYLDLRPIAKQAWQQLQTSQPISEWQGEKLYFNLRPQAIAISPFKVESDSLQSLLRLAVKPFAQNSPQAPTNNKPLPEVEIVENLSPQFKLYVEGQIPTRLIEQEIKRQFQNETFALKANKTARLRNARAYGSNDKMVFDLDMEGDISGKFYVWGSPHFESKNGKLEVKDIAYRSEGSMAFSKFIQRVFKGKIRRQLKKAVEEPLQAQMDSIAHNAQQNIRHYELNPGVYLKGNLQEFKWQEVWLSPQQTHGLLYLQGDAALIITEFGDL